VPAAPFRERLRSGPPLVLDAALGTDLLGRAARLSPSLWSAQALLDAPDLVEAIHRENAEAGADVLTIASFRLHARNVRESLCSLSQRKLIATAVNLARRAAGGEEKISSKVNMADAPRAAAPQGRRADRPRSSATRPSKKLFNDILIAGSLAPLEDCYRPDLVPKQENILFSEHSGMAAALAAAGVDLILVETMNTVREAAAAARGAAATGLPVVVSCVTDGAGRLLSGERVEDFAHALLALPLPPDALGVNCVAARALGADLARLAAAAPGVPLAAYGNTVGDPVEPAGYAALVTEWLALGARLVGGCCGTTAAHTRAVARLLKGNNRGSSSRAASDP
jgi:S-methylmethionine-dependent homocysteine/selenocysteine methylase